MLRGMARPGFLATSGRMGRQAIGGPAAPRTGGSGGPSMTSRDHIRNPAEWSVDQLKTANQAVGRAGHSLRRPVEARDAPLPAVRRIELADLWDVLVRGLSDLGA
jgi:hypothetical protein